MLEQRSYSTLQPTARFAPYAHVALNYYSTMPFASHGKSRGAPVYRFVVAMLACPSQLRITFTSTPDWSRCIAVVCRSVWGVTFRFCKLGRDSAALLAYRCTMS